MLPSHSHLLRLANWGAPSGVREIERGALFLASPLSKSEHGGGEEKLGYLQSKLAKQPLWADHCVIERLLTPRACQSSRALSVGAS